MSDRDRQLGLMGEALQATIFRNQTGTGEYILQLFLGVKPGDAFKMYIAKEYTYKKAKRPKA